VEFDFISNASVRCHCKSCVSVPHGGRWAVIITSMVTAQHVNKNHGDGGIHCLQSPVPISAYIRGQHFCVSVFRLVSLSRMWLAREQVKCTITATICYNRLFAAFTNFEIVADMSRWTHGSKVRQKSRRIGGRLSAAEDFR
jgi:hypothetical protein